MGEPEAVTDAGPDPQEFTQRIRENLDWLRGWMRGRIRDADVADDLCQDSFLKALRSAKALKDPARFSSWLFRIAVNTLRDHLRSEKRRRARLRFTGEIEELDTARTEAPSVIADRREAAAQLLDAIQALPEKLREPLLLRHSRGLAYAQIAGILGITENAVQVRIFRAREKLRKKLGKPAREV